MGVFLRGRTFISLAWNHPFSRSAKELFQNFDRLFPPEYKVSLSFFFVFGKKERKKEGGEGMKKETTAFKYNFPRWYGGRGSAQSTIRYSYVRGIHTACPNSAASFCGKIRAFRDRLNNNRPGLKRSNSSPGDIAVQKIYTEYVFLHHDPLSVFLSLRFFNGGTVNYRAANRDIW